MELLRIDETLLAALAHRWFEQDALHFASSIGVCFPGAILEWDQGDEGWIQVARGEVVAFVHVELPLLLTLEQNLPLVADLGADRVFAIVARSWDEKKFVVTPRVLVEVFPYHTFPEPVEKFIDAGLSLQSIWFFTN